MRHAVACDASLKIRSEKRELDSQSFPEFQYWQCCDVFKTDFYAYYHIILEFFGLGQFLVVCNRGPFYKSHNTASTRVDDRYVL